MSNISPIRLSELNARIKNVLETAFDSVSFWVIADVTNHTFRSQKNYHNFELVEKDPNSNNIMAKISSKAWGNGSNRIKNFESVTGQKFSDNINVLVQMKVTYHPVYGLSLELIEIDSNFTIGALQQQRRATLEMLVAQNDFIQKVGDNYITRNSQLRLPRVIQRIAVISSKNSAGGEDFHHTLKNNPFGYYFLVNEYHSVVQGENNANQFLAKLVEVYQSNIQYDAVVITRGGGAQTDFLIFDNYLIGRAVAKFPIPIITGIGHQKNETITDLMAHTQTKTPTKAAEFIIAHNKSFEDEVLGFQKVILIRSQQLFSNHLQTLSRLNSNVVNKVRDILSEQKDSLNQINQVTINTSKSILFNRRNELVGVSTQLLAKPKIILYNRFNDLGNTISNLSTFRTLYLKNKKGYLGHYISIINMIAPENILKRGFAIVKVNDRITSNADDIVVGEDIEIVFANTELVTTVKKKTKNDGE